MWNNLQRTSKECVVLGIVLAAFFGYVLVTGQTVYEVGQKFFDFLASFN